MPDSTEEKLFENNIILQMLHAVKLFLSYLELFIRNTMVVAQKTLQGKRGCERHSQTLNNSLIS